MTLLLVIFYFRDYVCTLLLQTIVVKCDYVPKECKQFYSCSSPNHKFFLQLPAFGCCFHYSITSYHCHPLTTTITFKGELLLSKCNCILVISYPLSPPFPFDHNYTCRRVKWGEHGMGPMQLWLTTVTPFKSQKILLKPEHWVQIFKKHISASNIRPALPSYMIYFISLPSSHPSWASTTPELR